MDVEKLKLLFKEKYMHKFYKITKYDLISFLLVSKSLNKKNLVGKFLSSNTKKLKASINTCLKPNLLTKLNKIFYY